MLNALIYYHKPKNVIETGTFYGFGTIAIAEALRKNGFGKVYSLEYKKRHIDIAIRNIELYDSDLLNYISFELADSRDWIKECKIKFDFGFFDSELEYRHVEYKLMLENNLMNENFVAMFHDTSRYRPKLMPNNSSSEMIEELDKLSKGKEWFEGIYSRGFRLLKP